MELAKQMLICCLCSQCLEGELLSFLSNFDKEMARVASFNEDADPGDCGDSSMSSKFVTL